MGSLVQKEGKHCFSLVCIYGFGGNNALYSASSSIYSLDKADFRVPAPKRQQPYLPIVTFSFLDAYEHSKNQHSFILEIQQIRESL